MENYIDWSGKTSSSNQAATPSQSQPNQSPSTYSQWQAAPSNTAKASSQSPYNTEGQNMNPNEQRPQAASPASFSHQSYGMPYVAGPQMSPSISPPITNGSQYPYTQTLPQTRPDTEEAPGTTGINSQSRHTQSASTSSQQSQQHSYPSQIHRPGYTNPYTYANNAIYGNMYAHPQQGTQGYAPQYNGHPVANAGPHGTYAGYQNSMPTAQMSHNVGHQMQYSYPQNGSHGQYVAQNTVSQYQRPEDALQRVNGNGQSWSPYQYTALPPQANNMQHAAYPYNNAAYAQQWQQQQQQQIQPKQLQPKSIQQQQPTTGQTVYFPLDNKPVQASSKPPTKPSSPPRPKDPIAALRYDVSHCFTEYNTSRDPKGCASALLAIMATCDPSVPTSDSSNSKAPDANNANDKSSVEKTTSVALDPKMKQTTLLSVVISDIKGAMVEEVSKNKSIRAKLRTWFVRAHKDNSYVVLKAIISVLDKLTFLSARLLAEVKFGKALVIVSRKCEDKEVKESLAPWVPKAEESLVVEKELEAAALKEAEDDQKRKKAKLSSNTPDTKSGKLPASTSSSPPPFKDAALNKKPDEKSKVLPAAAKKSDSVAAKVNTAFFKKDNVPAAKPVIAKPGMAAALAGIKARKKSDGEEVTKGKPAPGVSAAKSISSTVPRVLPTAKPAAFSALKLVEGLKRGASPASAPDSEPDLKKRKQKKSVTWRPDAELEQVKIFESIEPEDGEGDVAHTPHEYGNARDLDRKEGALLHSGVLPDREEDFLDWESPTALDFSHRDLLQGQESRGPKRAGLLTIRSKLNDNEEERQKSVFLVTYATESDIPWNPSETNAIDDLAQHVAQPPKIIPLPSELRDDWRIKQVLGDLVYATSQPVVVAPALPVTITGPTSVSNKENSAMEAKPDIAAILAGILATQASANTVAPINNFPITAPANLPAAASSIDATMNTFPPPPMPLPVDPKLAEFLANMAAANGGMLPPPPPPPLAQMQTSQQGSAGPSKPLSDVRPWVKLNDNGKYREPCRFIGLGKCEKGDACPYIHPQ